jgi:mevalonate kinase
LIFSDRAFSFHKMMKFRANGKLLIAGEYTVIDGGLSFAIPTKLGQTLEVTHSNSHDSSPKLFWEAILENHDTWFSVEFELNSLKILKCSDEILAQKLQDIFKSIEELNPNFFRNQIQTIHCKTQLEFPKDWGLGSSSTLIYLLAKWTGVDEFELSNLTFKTSGYDIACAGNDNPLLYKRENGIPLIESISFRPEFLDQLYFVYLNQKQDTQIGVSKQYQSKPKSQILIQEISQLVQEIYQAPTLEEFEFGIEKHENLLSEFLEIPKVKDLYFPDYLGSVKSLGAWGGDFVLVTARPHFKAYLQSKGYATLFSYQELVHKIS